MKKRLAAILAGLFLASSLSGLAANIELPYNKEELEKVYQGPADLDRDGNSESVAKVYKKHAENGELEVEVREFYKKTDTGIEEHPFAIWYDDCLEQPDFAPNAIYVDRDRDGVIDEAYEGYKAWQIRPIDVLPD